jgi:hypothetical protein
MLSVAKTPGAFGIHLYQVPSHRSRFQTQSIECMTGPNLSRLGSKLSLAKSLIIPLPDVSDDIFTCGLATFSIPCDIVYHEAYLSSLGIPKRHVHSIVWTISLTNKGDIYTHILLRSNGDKKHSIAFDGVPLGYSAIPVPPTVKISNRQWNVLPIALTNDFPTPGHTIRSTKTQCQSKMNPSTIDLSQFVNNEENTEPKQGRTRAQKRGPEPVPSTILESDVQDQEKTTKLYLDDALCRAVVATCPDVLGPLPLALPSHLLPEHTAAEHYTEHFLPVNQSDIELLQNQMEVPRSDLTLEVLGDAWIERDV